MNQVGLVGRFTKDPVLRYLSGNRMQTHFSLAINRNFKTIKGSRYRFCFLYSLGKACREYR